VRGKRSKFPTPGNSVNHEVAAAGDRQRCAGIAVERAANWPTPTPSASLMPIPAFDGMGQTRILDNAE
jgi:hypothetical protein